MSSNEIVARDTARPSPADIAKFVKDGRTLHDWKQLVLAHEAGVNVRTIERIESGVDRTNPETLTKVARAFRLPEDYFVNPGFWPSEEEIERISAEIKKERAVIDAHLLEKPMELGNILNAWLYMVDWSALSDDLAAEGAGIQDYIEDVGMIYDDATATDKLGYCQELFNLIRAIEARGYTAHWGCYTTDEKLPAGVLVFKDTAAEPSFQPFRKIVVPRSIRGRI